MSGGPSSQVAARARALDLSRCRDIQRFRRDLAERIHDRIRTPCDGGACGPVILAGPTRDSPDILDAKSLYELPLDLEIGDRIDVLSHGEVCGGGIQWIPPSTSRVV